MRQTERQRDLIRPQICSTRFAPLVTLVRHYVSTKLEASTVFLLRENQRHGRTDGQTDGRDATLNVASKEGSITTIRAYNQLGNQPIITGKENQQVRNNSHVGSVGIDLKELGGGGSAAEMFEILLRD